MSLKRDIALEVFGLPTYASIEDIIFRYRVLAALWYPERHNNCSFATEQFRQINESADLLIHSEESQEPMKLLDMYQLFQNLFFGVDETASDYEEDEEDLGSLSFELEDESADEKVESEATENAAAENANQLILEEEQEKLKAERKRAKKKLIMQEQEEKLRAARKRAKKKRRKERKKQQKVETETQKLNPLDKQTSTSNKEHKEKVKVKEIKEDKSSDSEEGIDPGSAFVAVIAKKHKHLIVPESKAKFDSSIHSLLPIEIKEDPTSIVLRSRQLALRANEMASVGHYSEAVDLFSESIKLDPTDHRFYGNRSYCFDRLGQFERALKDAEKSVALCPSWPKGYYRKGRALLGLKKCAQAEECFVKVLKLDNDCEDAISELHKVKIMQIIEMGYSKQQAEIALAKHSSVQESVESLLASGISKLKTTDEVEVFISDDESDGFWTMSKPSQSPSYDIKMDPRNPEHHNSLWIGNVQADVTEKKLITLFSKYGELLSVKVMPEKFCAFVNFKNKNSPGKAMQACQGLELHGANLVIRFPNLPGEAGSKKKPGATQEATKPKTTTTTTTDECYFWRTTGCIYGDNCRNRHVKEHKGMDKKKWHVAS